MWSSKHTFWQSHQLNCPLLRAARPCCCVLGLEGRVLKLFQLQNPIFLLLLNWKTLCFLHLSSILFSGLLSLGWQTALNAYKTSQSHSIFSACYVSEQWDVILLLGCVQICTGLWPKFSGVLVVFNFPHYLFNFVNPSGMLSLSLSLSLSLCSWFNSSINIKTLITSYIKSYWKF